MRSVAADFSLQITAPWLNKIHQTITFSLDSQHPVRAGNFVPQHGFHVPLEQRADAAGGLKAVAVPAAIQLPLKHRQRHPSNAHVGIVYFNEARLLAPGGEDWCAGRLEHNHRGLIRRLLSGRHVGTGSHGISSTERAVAWWHVLWSRGCRLWRAMRVLG